MKARRLTSRHLLGIRELSATDISLVLDTEGPEVKQWFAARGLIEVPGLVPECDVRNERGAAGGEVAERCQRVRGQHPESDQQRPTECGGQSGKYSDHAT